MLTDSEKSTHLRLLQIHEVLLYNGFLQNCLCFPVSVNLQHFELWYHVWVFFIIKSFLFYSVQICHS